MKIPPSREEQSVQVWRNDLQARCILMKHAIQVLHDGEAYRILSHANLYLQGRSEYEADRLGNCPAA